MCGLFGFINYSGEKIKNLLELTNSLAEQSAVRGTDATGIAYCKQGNINIVKEAKSAYVFDFKHPDDLVSVTGHTRHSTQGSEKRSYNNHPFYGRVRDVRFALAHNGVLSNDKDLRRRYKLPKTKVETDSYIAVQLLESKKELNAESIKFMAEAVDGSFSFSILDDKNNVYLVKGDSPLSILHFPKLKIYAYASTDEILYKALVDSPLFSALKKGEVEAVDISEGDILKIRPDGTIEKSSFEYSYYYGRNWWNYGCCSLSFSKPDEYITSLKSVASYMGFSPDKIQELFDSGFEPKEIEEYIYCMDGEV